MVIADLRLRHAAAKLNLHELTETMKSIKATITASVILNSPGLRNAEMRDAAVHEAINQDDGYAAVQARHVEAVAKEALLRARLEALEDVRRGMESDIAMDVEPMPLRMLIQDADPSCFTTVSAAKTPTLDALVAEFWGPK